MEFDLARASEVRLTIHDLSGRLIRRLVDEERTSARHAVVWNGQDDWGVRVAGGVYFAKLVAADGTNVRKIVLVR